MMEVLAPKAKENGYEPDCIVCPDEVPAGRPFPWMCYENAIRLGAYPMQAIVKVGDTLPDIERRLERRHVDGGAFHDRKFVGVERIRS